MITAHYASFLAIHSLLRWFVLIAGIVAIAGSLLGIVNNLPFKPLGRILGLIYVSLLDTQFLVGVLLSIASPIIHSFWVAPGTSMKVHDARFFALEHTLLMVIALAIAHIGAARSRRCENTLKAYTIAASWYAISLLLILIGIPWLRPLLRL